MRIQPFLYTQYGALSKPDGAVACGYIINTTKRPPFQVPPKSETPEPRNTSLELRRSFFSGVRFLLPCAYRLFFFRFDPRNRPGLGRFPRFFPD